MRSASFCTNCVRVSAIEAGTCSVTLALAKLVLKPRALIALGLAAGFGLGRLLAAATAAIGRHGSQHLLDVGAAAYERGLTAPGTLHTPAHDSLLTRQADNRRYGVRADRRQKDSG